MQAVVQNEFGGPDVLGFAMVDDPEPAPGWVQVRLRVSALNWHDILVRRGMYDSPLPHVPGADGAGVRADTGEEVVISPSLWWGGDTSAPGSDWQILGDRVRGTHAELVSVPADHVRPKPSGWSWQEAAAAPLVGMTAYRALVTRARLAPGERLLVLGAGGGLATMAVQLAGAIGASVWVTSSSQEKIERARSLGAVGGVRYNDPHWPALARDLVPGRGFDVVLDSVGTWQQGLDVLRPGGRMVVLGASMEEQPAIDARRFYFSQFDLLGSTMGSPADFDGFWDLARESGLRPVLDRSFPLDEAAAAHEYLESGHAFGKVTFIHE